MYFKQDHQAVSDGVKIVVMDGSYIKKYSSTF